MSVAIQSDTGTWPRDALPLGTVLYGYKIVGFLGRGGFGVTYRAVDRIDQMFALKECFPRQFAVRDRSTVLPADDDYAGQMFSKCLESFTKEALALTRFSKSGAAGDGVIKVITSFEANGTAYIVMEFVEGESLEREIAGYSGGMPEARLVSLLHHLTATLGCVHGNGLLHRDIKPANIILRPDGRPVLLDFGAARAVRADGPLPSQIYTETYAPIEQIEGRAQGPYSDLYSLGVTCYQALVGTRARSGATSAERFRAAMFKQPDPLIPATQIGAGRYKASLLHAIDALLRVAPEDRPQTVDEFVSILSRNDRAAEDERTVDVGRSISNRQIAATVYGDSVATKVNATAMPAAGATVVMPEVMSGAAGHSAEAGKSGAGPRLGIIASAVLMLAGAAGAGFWYLNKPKPVDSLKPVAAVSETIAAVKPVGPTQTPKNDRPAVLALNQGPASAAPVPEPGPGPSQTARLAEPKPPAPVTPPADPATPARTPMVEAAAAYDRKDYALALRGFLSVAQTGDAEAQYRVGYMYQLGQGVMADPVQAMIWYNRSAAQNFAAAQSQIGYLNQNGIGTPVDLAAAARWYGLAAAQGYRSAQFQLGYLAQHGFGMQKNYATALSWYRLAAAQGSAPAQNQIGYLYQLGLGVNMNYTEALSHYKAAAEMGLPAAQYQVGHFYAEGLGAPRDLVVARDWMSRAARGGNAEATTWLAEH